MLTFIVLANMYFHDSGEAWLHQGNVYKDR